jgi:hypothetical protein
MAARQSITADADRAKMVAKPDDSADRTHAGEASNPRIHLKAQDRGAFSSLSKKGND